ncbi:unnamed protein product [Cochlearia groenlandica]
MQESLFNQHSFASNSSVTSTSTISQTWRTSNDFCKSFGGPSDESGVCFNGHALVNGSYLNMVPYPDSSNRVFLSNQVGLIYLAKIPDEGSSEVMMIDENNLFLDLTKEVHFDGEFGLLGIAVHPEFLKNGRFFFSFNCDRVKWPECSERCHYKKTG